MAASRPLPRRPALPPSQPFHPLPKRGPLASSPPLVSFPNNVSIKKNSFTRKRGVSQFGCRDSLPLTDSSQALRRIAVKDGHRGQPSRKSVKDSRQGTLHAKTSISSLNRRSRAKTRPSIDVFGNIAKTDTKESSPPFSAPTPLPHRPPLPLNLPISLPRRCLQLLPLRKLRQDEIPLRHPRLALPVSYTHLTLPTIYSV